MRSSPGSRWSRATIHPSHYDTEYCRAHGHDDLLAHGFLVASFAAVGAGRFAHEISSSLIAFLRSVITGGGGGGGGGGFLKPGSCAATPCIHRVEISECIPQRTTGVIVMRVAIHNQKQECVMDGTHRYLVKKRPGMNAMVVPVPGNAPDARFRSKRKPPSARLKVVIVVDPCRNPPLDVGLFRRRGYSPESRPSLRAGCATGSSSIRWSSATVAEKLTGAARLTAHPRRSRG